MYDILKVMGKDAEFLYDTIDAYIENAKNANKQELAEMWKKIKCDRLSHANMLKDALEKKSTIDNLFRTKTRSSCGEL